MNSSGEAASLPNQLPGTRRSAARPFIDLMFGLRKVNR